MPVVVKINYVVKLICGGYDTVKAQSTAVLAPSGSFAGAKPNEDLTIIPAGSAIRQIKRPQFFNCGLLNKV